jgi:hypothetical protein
MLTVEDLQADCLSEPRALHNQTLRLSWRLRSRRGAMQQSYRIGVASTPKPPARAASTCGTAAPSPAARPSTSPMAARRCPHGALLLDRHRPR